VCALTYLSQRLEDEIAFGEVLCKNTRSCGRERPRPAGRFERRIPIPFPTLVTRQRQIRCTLSQVIHRGLATHPRLLLPLLDPLHVQPHAPLTTNASSQIVRFFPHPTNQVWTFWIVGSDFLTAKSSNCSIEVRLGVEVHERAIRSCDKENGRHPGILFYRFLRGIWRFIEELPKLLVGGVRRHVPRPHHPFRSLRRRVWMIRLADRFLTSAGRWRLDQRV